MKYADIEIHPDTFDNEEPKFYLIANPYEDITEEDYEAYKKGDMTNLRLVHFPFEDGHITNMLMLSKKGITDAH